MNNPIQFLAILLIIFSFYEKVLLDSISADFCDAAEDDETLTLWYSRVQKCVHGNENITHSITKINEKLQRMDFRMGECQSELKNVYIKTMKLEESLKELKRSQQLTCLSAASNNEIVIQRRQDGSVDFYRPWSDYKQGFGNATGEFFIGLDKLHQLTNSRPYELLIVMEDWDHDRRYAKYDQFIVGSEKEKYKLKSLGSYSGSAGDSLSSHLGQKFSTKDQDNDASKGEHCAVKYTGAWWYNACHASNLNGRYLQGQHKEYAVSVIWFHFKGHHYSLKFAEMILRPK